MRISLSSQRGLAPQALVVAHQKIDFRSAMILALSQLSLTMSDFTVRSLLLSERLCNRVDRRYQSDAQSGQDVWSKKSVNRIVAQYGRYHRLPYPCCSDRHERSCTGQVPVPQKVRLWACALTE